MARFFCSMAFANAIGNHCPAYLWSSNLQNTSLYQRLALRSWPRSKLARRLLLFSWCVMRAED
jgi:hypothetical protein